MLVIDENLLKLCKMQETLLKVSKNDKEANIEKYKAIAIEIDKHSFSSLLEELNQYDKHNQTLEDELQFLEQIKSYYEQLLEMQLSFKRVCELYGDGNIQLSDLSQINIEYINSRVNAISGYLVNLKNIEDDKEKLEDLNEQLVAEEKKKSFLSKKLLELEDLLRESFSNAEGRAIEDGQLKSVSIISEYKDLGYNFKALLVDCETLDKLLTEVDKEKVELEEKLKTAEICYNSLPSSDNKQILDDIKTDFLRVKYKLILLKILELLAQNYDNYDTFKEKREKLLDLVRYRNSCLEKLGIHMSIDPFRKNSLLDQLKLLTSLDDNSKNTNKIKKEIAWLSEHIDDMLRQNNDYMITINNFEELVISNVRISDIDISSISLNDDEQSENKISDNQVTSIKDIPNGFNMPIIRQKTAGVISRVNEMITAMSASTSSKEKVVSPELVVVSETNDNKSHLDTAESNIFIEELEEKNEVDTYNSDIFETVIPFETAPLFSERTEETDIDKIKGSVDNEELLDELPDAFWVTQDEESEKEITPIGDDKIISFDEQINALLSDNGDTGTKIKKLAA